MKKVLFLAALIGMPYFLANGAESEPFSKPSGTYCCDFRESSQKCVEVVDKCDPGAIEISATANSTIKVGYRYIGPAPVYIRLKNCPTGTVLPIISQPSKDDDGLIKEQVAEYICGNQEPVKIKFDMENGSRTFSYYDRPQPCSPDGCSQITKEK